MALPADAFPALAGETALAPGGRQAPLVLSAWDPRDPERRHGGREQRRKRATRPSRPLLGDVTGDRDRCVERPTRLSRAYRPLDLCAIRRAS